jgi:phage tail sheath gpL-like
LAYASPFVGPVGHTAHVKVDVSALTNTQVDSKGILKPGVVLTLDGIAPSDTVGTKQVETATVLGSVGASGAGNATVIITSPLLPGGTKTLSVAVANNDTAAQVAAKIRTALAADGDINDVFSVGGSGADVVLTALVPAANDATLNVSIDNGTSTGLTAAPTSVNTTAGVAGGANAVICMVKEATKIAENNTGLASITDDPFVACATIAQANRDIVEDNLGRALNAAEVAALNSERSHIVLLLT